MVFPGPGEDRQRVCVEKVFHDGRLRSEDRNHQMYNLGGRKGGTFSTCGRNLGGGGEEKSLLRSCKHTIRRTEVPERRKTNKGANTVKLEKKRYSLILEICK